LYYLALQYIWPMDTFDNRPKAFASWYESDCGHIEDLMLGGQNIGKLSNLPHRVFDLVNRLA
jgi:hypothetical protein